MPERFKMDYTWKQTWKGIPQIPIGDRDFKTWFSVGSFRYWWEVVNRVYREQD